MTEKLKPCPFCGSDAEIEQIGDRRRSTIYSCNSCSCVLETGEEWGHGRQWNQRPREDAMESALAGQSKLLDQLTTETTALLARALIAEAKKEVAEDRVEFFNHNLQPLVGIVGLDISNGNLDEARKSFKKLLDEWDRTHAWAGNAS